uniref:Uncharacterized protein n=1 Tax=Globodera rostochiensis TaxID=31243 RepID=A0A914IDY6_GLORO
MHHQLILFIFIIISFGSIVCVGFTLEPFKNGCKIYIWMTHLLNDAFRPFQLATIVGHFGGATKIEYNLFETKKYFEEQFNKLKCNNVSSNLNLNESILIYRTIWPNNDIDKETLQIVDDLLAMCLNFQQPGLYKHLRAFFHSNQINEAILMLEKRHSKTKLAKNVMEIKKQIDRIRGRNDIDFKNVTIFNVMMKKLSVKLRKTMNN